MFWLPNVATIGTGPKACSVSGYFPFDNWKSLDFYTHSSVFRINRVEPKLIVFGGSLLPGATA